MESGNKNFLAKTWKRYQSFKRSSVVRGLMKSKSWSGKEMRKKKMAPQGYFPVCVGPEKQRFAMKMKYANHPLFMLLLEDAETELGNNCEGPISLPCDVDLFYKVLAEMEATDVQPLGWSFANGCYSPFSPSRRLERNGVDQMAKGYGAFGTLSSSTLIKMN